jgi:hypothetical protein
MDCNGECGGNNLMTTVYEDSDGDDLGNSTVMDIICSANIPEGWVTNADDTDDNCSSNIHDECNICDGDGYVANCLDNLCENMDFCGTCYINDGDNGCIPVIIESSHTDGSINLHEESINISFSVPLLSSSLEAVTLTSLTNSTLVYNTSIISDTSIHIGFDSFSSRDTILLDIQANLIVTADNYNLDNDSFNTPPGDSLDNINWTLFTETLGDYNSNDE